jgi:hypothetical protein
MKVKSSCYLMVIFFFFTVFSFTNKPAVYLSQSSNKNSILFVSLGKVEDGSRGQLIYPIAGVLLRKTQTKIAVHIRSGAPGSCGNNSYTGNASFFFIQNLTGSFSVCAKEIREQMVNKKIKICRTAII